MTIYYLYVKTHNITGLKYLGKTKNDPYKYKGSGKYWGHHIKLHGYNVTTEILRECQSNKEVKEWGIYYSSLWNIVESNDWANLKLEEGDGGDNSHTDNFKNWITTMKIEYKKHRWWNNEIEQVFCKAPPNLNFVPGRLKFNNRGAKIGAEKQKGKYWVNNGNHEMMIGPDEVVPEGYSLGRVYNTEKYKPKVTVAGTKWWNNGVISIMTKENPGPGWSLGRIKHS